MIFVLNLQSLPRVVFLFCLGVYIFCCIKLFDVVCFFRNQTFLKILV